VNVRTVFTSGSLAVRVGWGVVLLVRTEKVLALLSGDSVPSGGAGPSGDPVLSGGAGPGDGAGAAGRRDLRRARTVLRVLGARQILQGVTEALLLGAHVPASTLRLPATAVDSLHAASCFGFAAMDQRWRRVAMADGMIASTCAMLDLALLGR